MTTTDPETKDGRLPAQTLKPKSRVLSLFLSMALIGFAGWYLGLKSGEARSRALVDRLQSESKTKNIALYQLQSAHRTLSARYGKITRDNVRLRTQMGEQRALVRQTTVSLKRRMERAIWRNGASGVAGNVPILGDAADAAATAMDVWEYKQMMGNLDQLDSAFLIAPKKGVRHHQSTNPSRP